MDAQQFKEDVRQGRISVDRLLDLVVSLQRQWDEARRPIEQRQQNLGGPATVKLEEPFSLRAQEQRQQRRSGSHRKRKGNQRRGRTKTADKVARAAQAARVETVYPRDVPAEACWLSPTRPVWRLENGQAVRVAYALYRGPKNRYGRPSAKNSCGGC